MEFNLWLHNQLEKFQFDLAFAVEIQLEYVVWLFVNIFTAMGFNFND